MGEGQKAKKVTIMVLKVDLQCRKCYKKVKKVLCKFPQIRDQLYDEKQNQVVIKVVCCSPEKIRDKICCKGGGAIISIEIKEPEPKETEKTKKPKAAPNNPKEGPPKPKPKQQPPPAQPLRMPIPIVPCYLTCVPVDTCCRECYQSHPEGPCYSGPSPFPVVPCYPQRVPVNTCCTECHQGRPEGPCYSSYGGGPAPYIQYDGYYGRPVYDSYGGGGSRGYPDSFSEENPQACTIM